MIGSMAKQLTDSFVKTAGEGEYTDQTRGLSLIVRPSTAKGGGALRRSWVFRHTFRGKRQRLGLGAYPQVSLKQARNKAAEAARLVDRGESPIEKRKAARRTPEVQQLTFARVVEMHLDEALSKFQRQKSRTDLIRALRRHCAPLAERPIEQISVRDVAGLLKSIAQKSPQAAEKVRGALRGLFAFAAIEMEDRGVVLRNPVAAPLLRAAHYSAPSGPTRGHHPALDYRNMPEFMEALAEREGPAARLLEFIILTIARAGAARFARFDQLDFEQKIWRLPSEQLKDARHRKGGHFIVPLSAQALVNVRKMQEQHNSRSNRSPFVFCDAAGEQLNDMATIVLLRNMCVERHWVDPNSKKPITTHGFMGDFSIMGASCPSRSRAGRAQHGTPLLRISGRAIYGR
jgi:hypothetical protein